MSSSPPESLALVPAAPTACPRCGAAIVPPADLPARGRCAACGTAFDLAPVPVVGDGPHRVVRATDVRIGIGPVTGDRIVDRSDGAALRELQIRSSSESRPWLRLSLSAAALFFFVMRALAARSLGTFTAIAIAGFGVSAALRLHGIVQQRAHLRLDAGELVAKRWFGLRRRRIRVDTIVRFELDIADRAGKERWWLCAVLNDGRKVRLARVDHLDGGHRYWLLDHLKQGLELATTLLPSIEERGRR